MLKIAINWEVSYKWTLPGISADYVYLSILLSTIKITCLLFVLCQHRYKRSHSEIHAEMSTHSILLNFSSFFLSPSLFIHSIIQFSRRL